MHYKNMAIITIPKKLIKNDDLVVVPRKEYELILEMAKKRAVVDWIYFEPFSLELKKRIMTAKKELKQKKIIAWRRA